MKRGIKIKIANWFATTKLRIERGEHLTGFFLTARVYDFIWWSSNIGIILFLFFGVKVDSIPTSLLWLMGLGVVLKIIISYYTGYFDERVGFWKWENRRRSEKLNSFYVERFNSIDNQLTELKRSIKKLK